jgi:uncharacterized protein YndB with AHSA1/START domain
VEHATFVVERRYEVSPEQAFAAWADPEAKARWYTDSDTHLEQEQDSRPALLLVVRREGSEERLEMLAW